MGPLFVVAPQSFGPDLPDLIQGVKHIGFQYFRALRPVKPFDEGVLIRLHQLDVAQLDSPYCARTFTVLPVFFVQSLRVELGLLALIMSNASIRSVGIVLHCLTPI